MTQLIGGSLAAATAAALGSRLGVVGTIAGAAVLSVVSATAASLYTNSMARAKEAVVLVRSRRGADGVEMAVVRERWWRRPDRTTMRRVLATTAAVFAIAAAFLTGLQAGDRRPGHRHQPRRPCRGRRGGLPRGIPRRAGAAGQPRRGLRGPVGRLGVERLGSEPRRHDAGDGPGDRRRLRDGPGVDRRHHACPHRDADPVCRVDRKLGNGDRPCGRRRDRHPDRSLTPS